MNYEVRRRNDQYVVLVHDHRAVIPAVFAATRDRLYSSPPLLFRIDAHDDFAQEEVNYSEEASKITSLESCMTFANRLKSDDGGWVEAVVRLGLVSDVVTWYVQERSSELHDECSRVRDLRGHEHRIFSLGSLRISFAPHSGALGDAARRSEHSELHEALSWDVTTGLKWPQGSEPEIWFDIDLDFAVHHLGDFGDMPWRRQDFLKEFLAPIPGSLHRYLHGNVADFVTCFLRRARLVTIALEPRYSCGFRGVSCILENLDDIFGDNGDWFDWLTK